MSKEERFSLLSSTWMNARVRNIEGWVERLVDRILLEGIISTGFLPFEEPITKAHLKRMTPEQFDSVIQQVTDEQVRQHLLQMAEEVDDSAPSMVE